MNTKKLKVVLDRHKKEVKKSKEANFNFKLENNRKILVEGLNILSKVTGINSTLFMNEDLIETFALSQTILEE